MGKMITPEAVAELMAVRPSTVREWVKRGQIPAYKVGGTVRFDEDELAEFLKASRVGLRRAS